MSIHLNLREEIKQITQTKNHQKTQLKSLVSDHLKINANFIKCDTDQKPKEQGK